MVKGPESLLEGVAEETISEMATSFFGARKEVEDLLERIDALTAELRSQAGGVQARIRAVNALLPENGRAGFYRAVGVDPQPFLDLPDGPVAEPPKGGFALTASGRYAAQGLAAYQALFEALEMYLHGEYTPDPDSPGHMRLSPNLDLLKRLVKSVNQRIQDVNQTPSHVLGYLRKLNVAETSKEKYTGATLGDFADRADASLAYTPVDPAGLGLPEWPDLPLLKNVRAPLSKLLKDLHRNRS